MNDQFEWAAGSVVGKDHRRAGRNNQDAYHVAATADYLIAVVADGCGSSPHSEVGAQLGVRFAARIIAKELEKRGNGGYLWINRALVGELNVLKRWLGDDPIKATYDYLLFSLVGAVITPDTAEFFSFGDGVVGVNGQITQISFPGNAPPYPAYQLLENNGISPEWLQFQLHHRLPTAELESFLIGTDGTGDLIAAANLNLPGQVELVGPVEQLWQDNRFYNNPDALRRHLAKVNRESVKIDRETLTLRRELGHLSDDTTIITGRRKEASHEDCLSRRAADSA